MLTGVLVAAICAYQGASQSRQTTKPIEQLRVGQKVRTEAPAEALAAAEGELSHLLLHDEPTVDPATWKLVRLRAEQRWDDGTLDDINVETLQPPEWLAEHNVRVGGEVPLPLDLVEMGLPMDLQAKVLAIERCPPLQSGAGRIVLTTVNHLNRDVVELTIRDAHGREETIRPTGLHKFYSATRNDWLSAADLQPGEQLDGLIGLHTVVALRHFPGTHRVYNMTVEGEHVYRVSNCGLLVHNNGCASILLDGPRTNFIYRLVDNKGRTVYYGVADGVDNIALRFTDHLGKKSGQWKEMHVIGKDMTRREALTVEAWLIDDGLEHGYPLLNSQSRSIRVADMASITGLIESLDHILTIVR